MMKCFRYVGLNVINFTFKNVLRWLTRKFKITYMVVTVALSAGFNATLQGSVCIPQTLPRILGTVSWRSPMCLEDILILS